MSDDPSLFIEDTRSNWIRLRTSIAIRWVAIVGQLIAVFVALQYYRLQIPIDYCLLFIGLSIIANLLPPIYIPKTNDYPKQKTCCLLYSICSNSRL